MSYGDHLTQDRRRCILMVLSKSGGYQGNEYLIQSAIQSQGHNVSADRVRTDLAWLGEQGLLVCENVGGVTLATLQETGADVVAGTQIIPGVRKPRPGE